jgi:hypothetical protein
MEIRRCPFNLADMLAAYDCLQMLFVKLDGFRGGYLIPKHCNFLFFSALIVDTLPTLPPDLPQDLTEAVS